VHLLPPLDLGNGNRRSSTVDYHGQHEVKGSPQLQFALTREQHKVRRAGGALAPLVALGCVGGIDDMTGEGVNESVGGAQMGDVKRRRW
jgi:hypothetical protein